MNRFEFTAGRFSLRKGLLIFLLATALSVTVIGFSSCASNRSFPSETRAYRDEELAGVKSSEKTDGDTDYDEYDLVILRYYSAAPTSEVADALTEELGWNIKIVTYDFDDHYKLNTKLMAGDDDFDLYIDASSDFSKYILNGFYTDLKQFEGLNEKMSANRIVDFAADYNGEYIGLPLSLRYNDGLIFSYSSPTILDYCAKNVDTLEKRFSDPDGEKLFEALRYVYDNGGDVKDDPREYIDFTFVESSYCVMSPNSKHMDAAALFMERLFDAVESLPESPASGPYPDVSNADLSNAYLTWKFMSIDVRDPIIDAYLAALESDGKDRTLKKLAKDAAGEVDMRVGE